MNRFFVNPSEIANGVVSIGGEDVEHINRVLRLTPGDSIEVCDGAGNDYIAKISVADKRQVIAEVLDCFPSQGEPKGFVTLYQGLPKSTKMDLIVQKCTELGVGRIVPVMTKRTVVKLESAKDVAKKTERWQKIAAEAAKQSKRGIIPTVAEPMSFSAALSELTDMELALIPYEGEDGISIKPVLQGGKKDRMALMIGPEGGFDEVEIQQARAAGVIPVTLGKRILRTESAGMAALSMILYEYEL